LLPTDEADGWGAIVTALRSKGATHDEAAEVANVVLEVYREQRRGLASQGGAGAPAP
jgi:hypothetical protein